MFCTNCGKELPDGSAFCTNCGMKISSDPAKNKLTQLKRRSRKRLPLRNRMQRPKRKMKQIGKGSRHRRNPLRLFQAKRREKTMRMPLRGKSLGKIQSII